MAKFKIPTNIESGLQNLLARCRRTYHYDRERSLFVWRFNGTEHTGATGDELVYNVYRSMVQ